MEGKKFIVGLCGVLVLLLLGGLYKVNIYDGKIVVSLPSDVCNAATLRVTKDDFTLKCGRFIAFQADTITEYYKTYGTDEWVRNNRFVGLNKKHITLELTDYGDYFDIVRKTRYRKGRQNIDDGVLYETYTFTGDKVKISYNYEVNNKALHRISMRIKKQVDSYLDAFDPNGHTGVLMGNVLSYEGYGNLLIDPSVTLHTPADISMYNESDTISLICSVNQSNDTTLTSIKLWWNADNESLFEVNGTETITGNATAIFSRVIPHPITSTFPGTFKWGCEGINSTCISDTNCTFSVNRTIDARYKPEAPDISSPDDVNLNLFNGSGLVWDMVSFYPKYMNFSHNQSVMINWSHPGIRDNSTSVVYNLSYYGTTNNSRRYDGFDFIAGNDNDTTYAFWNVSKRESDLYYITLTACNALVTSLCANDTITNPVDIFDYDINISTGETRIRFSPQPTITKGAALGQTASDGIISIDWLGNRYPDGKINLSMKAGINDACVTTYAYNSNTPASAVTLANNTYVTVINTTDADPDGIWVWATKSSCGTTTTTFTVDLDLFFGGT